MPSDPTLIQVRRVLGTITRPGVDFIAAYAGGGSQKAPSEAAAVDLFKRTMGQSLKGNLVLERAPGCPTLVVLEMVDTASYTMFGDNYLLNYAGMGCFGFSTQNTNKIVSWTNLAKLSSNLNHLQQGGSANLAPNYDAVTLGKPSASGDGVTAVQMLCGSVLPQVFTAFLVVGQNQALSTGTVWTALGPGPMVSEGTQISANPDLALTSNAGNLELISASSPDSPISLGINLALKPAYVVTISRGASGTVKVWDGTTLKSTTSGLKQLGDYARYALFHGATGAAKWAGNLGSFTLVGRAVTDAERNSYVAVLKQQFSIA